MGDVGRIHIVRFVVFGISPVVARLCQLDLDLKLEVRQDATIDLERCDVGTELVRVAKLTNELQFFFIAYLLPFINYR